MKSVTIEPTFESFRDAARTLLAGGVSPSDVQWIDRAAEQNLLTLGAAPQHLPDRASRVSVPRAYVELARLVALHRDPAKWSLLYRLLWRITHENGDLLKVDIDDDVRRLKLMHHHVKRDEHKMHAFVRFRRIEEEGDEAFIAWYEPDHHIVRLAAPFFRERFATMRWSILTPDECAHWDRETLTFTPGVSRDAAPQDDELENLWRTYYGSIFNPARIKTKAMKTEMPVRFWRNMPEAADVSRLLLDAPRRVETMLRTQAAAPSARPFVPQVDSLEELAEAAAKCQGCSLYECATQTVFGRGNADARMMLVGEQPGDVEDRVGVPFVGPAGEVFDEALHAVGIDREELYVTNSVKHFKYQQRGKQRIHRTPDRVEIVACRPWVEAELQLVQPDVLVCLGATASRSLLGATFQLMKQRGSLFASPWCDQTIATIHPSAVLRAHDSSTREQLFGFLVNDLRVAARAL